MADSVTGNKRTEQPVSDIPKSSKAKKPKKIGGWASLVSPDFTSPSFEDLEKDSFDVLHVAMWDHGVRLAISANVATFISDGDIECVDGIPCFLNPAVVCAFAKMRPLVNAALPALVANSKAKLKMAFFKYDLGQPGVSMFVDFVDNVLTICTQEER